MPTGRSDQDKLEANLAPADSFAVNRGTATQASTAIIAAVTGRRYIVRGFSVTVDASPVNAADWSVIVGSQVVVGGQVAANNIRPLYVDLGAGIESGGSGLPAAITVGSMGAGVSGDVSIWAKSVDAGD